jgi:hypothetical protein
MERSVRDCICLQSEGTARQSGLELGRHPIVDVKVGQGKGA